ncbi:MAG TPA: peptidase S53, partial [Ktedonobacteraceae bacterium]|nr:peptidase S53 [Ktedonobacteraceae bacterium]
YFSNINAGNAGIVSGGADVIGVQALASDWLFAEGFTGSQFQENLTIANLDTVANTTAAVTIKLDIQGAPSQTFQLNIPTLSQVIWNVNAFAPNLTISAEITSSGAKVVAEREMYFHYGGQFATGGTDALGQPGPAAQSLYSFAEGYTAPGYNEWLTLQNPTANAETIYVTLYNALGNSFTFSMNVPAQSRATVNVNGVVSTSLYRNGDGFKGYEVSMTVQTTNVGGGPFVVERPMYWNASGTQGGTDIIGYIGG